jgi:hypothetical protein
MSVDTWQFSRKLLKAEASNRSIFWHNFFGFAVPILLALPMQNENYLIRMKNYSVVEALFFPISGGFTYLASGALRSNVLIYLLIVICNFFKRSAHENALDHQLHDQLRKR